ncbi:hypothetical protein SAMN05421882_10757 [Nitrosomonas communis]|uniref:Uncharacterized protein n=1 Tax=Nitrosomonas communis TaxID=44574 RepID=A0A1H2ZI27_9PROT|nr:hypothetical protein SAMN05421882_10757 [Nitrosomonas communis]
MTKLGWPFPFYFSRIYWDSYRFLRTSRFQEIPKFRSFFLSLRHYSLRSYPSYKREAHYLVFIYP